MKLKKLAIGAVCALTAFGAVLSLPACGTSKPVKVLDIELTAEDYAFAIDKENNDLLTNVNNYLTEWENDGTLSALINSYFDGTATFSYTNKTSVAQSNDFVVATNAYFPPFESYDANGKFYGVDIEIAYNIANKLNKTLFVKDMEFDSVISDVDSGKSDIGMAGLTVTDTRLQQVNFAKPYYTSSQVITVAEDDTTFDGCTTKDEIVTILNGKSKGYIIGTQSGTTGYMYSAGNTDFEYDGFTNLTTKAYSTGALAMKDLSNGKINAVIIDKQPAKMIVASINK